MHERIRLVPERLGVTWPINRVTKVSGCWRFQIKPVNEPVTLIAVFSSGSYPLRVTCLCIRQVKEIAASDGTIRYGARNSSFDE